MMMIIYYICISIYFPDDKAIACPKPDGMLYKSAI